VSRIFVDTSALIAYLDSDDSRHPAVRDAFLAHMGDDLVTHGYVVAESLAVVRRTLGLDVVTTLMDDLLPLIEILSVDLLLHAGAQAAYRASLPSGTSFVDRVSLSVIDREGIRTALVLDADFLAAGVEILPPI
jgi:predicted nucleic acid-binding protein